MPLKRISEQRSMTIEAFYIERTKENNSHSIEIGNAMLSFIEMINQLFPQTTIWCLTSHYKLVFLSENNSKSDWYISTIGTDNNLFYFDYQIQKENRPWENARVQGEASSLEEAKKYLLIAMKESGGWSTNEELKQLLKDNLLT